MDFEDEENELITALNEEVDQWKAKYKQLELQKRSSDIALNKIKTEINSLRSVDKQWKESAKAVYFNLNDLKYQFDAQIDQVVEGLEGISKAGERVTAKIPYNRKLKSTIAALQKRIAQQEESILNLNAKIRVLEADLADQTSKVKRLSQGIDEEVERLMKPMRDKLSDAMILIMKEKASRAQERRELADLWPEEHLMPSILMKHRALTPEERSRRVKITKQQNASYALAQEIRTNVMESKMWEVKYDDYGRTFYEHMKTGQTEWDPPAIMSYKPPPGRDEMGNIIGQEENKMGQWILKTDGKGQVYYINKVTGGVTYIPPFAYQEIPKGKSREVMVGEAAQLVLSFIKEKITKHIERTRELKDKLENPLTPEEVRKKEKEEKNLSQEEKDIIAAEKAAREEEDANEKIELTEYQYDIETVEMLSEKLTDNPLNRAAGSSKEVEKDPAEIRKEKRAFLEGSEVRKFDPELCLGTTIAEYDLEVITVPQLRGIVEDYSLAEEKLEKQLARVRDNMKDFSFVLMDRMAVEEAEEAERIKRELEEKEKVRRANQKLFMMEKQQEAKRLAMEQRSERLVDGESGRQMQEDVEQERLDLLKGEGKHDEATENVDPLSNEPSSGTAPANVDSSNPEQVDDSASEGRNSKRQRDGEPTSNNETDAIAESEGAPGDSVLPGSFDADEDAKRRKKRRRKNQKREDRQLLADEVIDSLENDDEQRFDPETDGEDRASDDSGSESGSDDSDSDESSEEERIKYDPNDPNFFDMGVSPGINYGEMLLKPPTFISGEPDFSEEMLNLGANLANFALFCGFTNLRISEYPHDSTVDYSLQLDECRGTHNTQDDSWLSSSFFLSCTREKLDDLRAANAQAYRASHGMLPIGPLDSEVLEWETPQLQSVQRKLEKSYTYGTSEVEETTRDNYAAWRDRQLMTEVIRWQIQQEAVHEAYNHRMEAFKNATIYNVDGLQSLDGTLNLAPSTMSSNTVPLVTVRIKKIFFDKKFSGVTENQFYSFIKLGSWVTRTFAQVPTPHGFRWDDLSLHGTVPINDVQIDYLVIEFIDQNPVGRDEQAFVGKGRVCIESSLGFNMGRIMKYDVEIYDDEKSMIGTAHIYLTANADNFVPAREMDPRHLRQLEINIKSPEEVENETGSHLQMQLDSEVIVNEKIPQAMSNPPDPLAEKSEQEELLPTTIASTADASGSDKSKKIAVDAQSKDVMSEIGTVGNGGISSVGGTAQITSFTERIDSLRALVGDLRGDGMDFVKLLTGDVNVHEVKRLGVNIGANITKNLPNFSHSTKYLEIKTNRHRWELEKILSAIDEEEEELITFLEKKYEDISKIADEMRGKVQKMHNQTEDMKREVLKAQKVVSDARKVHPEPKEPVFEEFPPVPHVPKLPVSGGLDSRGKKKKAIPTAELKKILESVEKGELDGQELWPISDQFFPSQQQMVKLNKAMTARNQVLDQLRDQEKQLRDRLLESYMIEHERWVGMEKKRAMDLEKAKKECRKVNMKYDSFMELMNRTQNDFDSTELDLQTVEDLKNLHQKSKTRFKIMRFKQHMEYRRIQDYLVSLKKRLLRALNARRYAIDLPGTATNDVEYAQLLRRSESCLRTLKFEIFECRELLLSEGVRLRTLFEEETKISTNELSRLRMSKEVIIQRSCFDQILSKYRFEVLHLLKSMEKLKAAETDKDETGLETVDDLGERYIPEKKWSSPEIQRCQKLIDIAMAKINLTEGLGKSTGQSQKLLMDVMTAKFGGSVLPMRDSWTENADFVRAQRLLEDALQWSQHERMKLKDAQKRIERDKGDLHLQLQALNEQREVAVDTHEKETVAVVESSTEVVEVMRGHLKEYREETSLQLIEKDQQIVELSRECQNVREDLLAQQMLFDEKIKVLWAFIHTLQTAVQQLSARMEMALEEREKIVIQSKLVADRMRHHLRLERNHCSNLLFIIQSQRGTVKFLTDVIAKLSHEAKQYRNQQAIEKGNLRREIWEQVFAFTRLGTDVDALFEFFAARLANLAGARSTLNNALQRNNAAQVLASLCNSPRPLIRKFAARGLGGMGWDGFVETRILLWDCVMYWKIYKAKVIASEAEVFQKGLDSFNEDGKYEAILNIKGEVEEFVPSGNMSLRTIIKQRRQWALRAARRREGPNSANQREISVKNGVIPALMQMCIRDGDVDWEISRNAALAVSIASMEQQNHHDMAHTPVCVDMLIKMCSGIDPEVQTHAAVTIANLCHKNEDAQLIFGDAGAITYMIDMSNSSVVDILEATTSALANLTCNCEVNSRRALDQGAVEAMVRVITHSYSQNLLDLDQNDEVQANAAETLANISRYSTDETLPFFSAPVIDALVVLSASPNKQVRRHVPLVLGNIAQSENCRFEIGVRGGIEALFLALEDPDNTIQANTLWALCNMMWHPPNQERAGRFMTEIVGFLQSAWMPTRVQSITLLANTLYYNNSNRIRLLECDGGMELILKFIREKSEMPLVEGSLRALLSISYIDAIALWLGTEGEIIPTILSYLRDPFYSRDSMRYALEIACNLCLHHANRRIIYENDGIDLVVSLHIDEDDHVREISKQIIAHIEDITPAEVLARAKAKVGLERMVTMASSSDPLVRAVAAESIGEEVWHNPQLQSRAQQVGGVDALLGVLANATEGEPVESVLPALWSLRNLMHENSDAKAQFGHRDGVSVVNGVLRQGFAGGYAEQTEKVFEAAIACFTTATAQNERNARRLLMIALPPMIDLADGQMRQMIPLAPTSVPTDPSDTVTLQRQEELLDHVLAALSSEGVNSLAKSLLLLLAPYNYVVCKNCHKKQDLHGTSCFNCGYRLFVDVDVPEIELRRLLTRPQSASQQKSLQYSSKKNARSGSSALSSDWRQGIATADNLRMTKTNQIALDEVKADKRQRRMQIGELASRTAPAGVMGIKRMVSEERKRQSLTYQQHKDSDYVSSNENKQVGPFSQDDKLEKSEKNDSDVLGPVHGDGRLRSPQAPLHSSTGKQSLRGLGEYLGSSSQKQIPQDSSLSPPRAQRPDST